MNRMDRCDSCGAQAQARVVNIYTFDLQFCGHHMHQYGDALDKQGFVAVTPIEKTPELA